MCPTAVGCDRGGDGSGKGGVSSSESSGDYWRYVAMFAVAWMVVVAH